MPTGFVIAKMLAVNRNHEFDSQAIFIADHCFLKQKILIDSVKNWRKAYDFRRKNIS